MALRLCTGLRGWRAWWTDSKLQPENSVQISLDMLDILCLLSWVFLLWFFADIWQFICKPGLPTLLTPTTTTYHNTYLRDSLLSSACPRTRMNYSGYYQPDIPKIWAATVARVLFHTDACRYRPSCDLGPGWKAGAGSWGKFGQDPVKPKSMMHSDAKKDLSTTASSDHWQMLILFDTFLYGNDI
jgi:hypothetical protein